MLRDHQPLEQEGAGSQDHHQELTQQIQSQTKSKLVVIQLISEIKIHKSLSHEHIVSFEHVFEDH